MIEYYIAPRFILLIGNIYIYEKYLIVNLNLHILWIVSRKM